MPYYASISFLSAFLLFQIQPLFARQILPIFGGTPGVWTTCLLFFQVILLFGYTYAHLTCSRLKPMHQKTLHLFLLVTALLLLPPRLEAQSLHLSPAGSPISQILILLLIHIGPPYFLLSATAPLIQNWFNHSHPNKEPYRLYAFSNAGSLLALISYPLIFEPTFRLYEQANIWSLGFGVLCALFYICAFKYRHFNQRINEKTTDSFKDTHNLTKLETHRFPNSSRIILWLSLSLFGSALLVATTNQICQEIATFPFLWILPLSIYLMSFILCFARGGGYNTRLWGLFLNLMTPLAWAIFLSTKFTGFSTQILIYTATLLACCMTCHGELARTKPDPKHLTLYYMIIAIGSAMGAIFVALVAPRLFSQFWEYGIALTGCYFCVLASWRADEYGLPQIMKNNWLIKTTASCQIGFILGLCYLSLSQEPSLFKKRNFYGVISISEIGDETNRIRSLMHGQTIHGLQFVAKGKSMTPTSYYGKDSAVGLALRYHPNRTRAIDNKEGLRVGIVGLGAGTLAAYSQKRDMFRFYEINPDVIEAAKKHFSFLQKAQGKIEVVPGDARVNLESELSSGEIQNFDILVLDAFSSDSIPIHLLTKQCAEVYWRHLKKDGLLLLHITNRYVDLTNQTIKIAEFLNCEIAILKNDGIETHGTTRSKWAIITKNSDFLSNEKISDSKTPIKVSDYSEPLWTDDFSSLWSSIRL